MLPRSGGGHLPKPDTHTERHPRITNVSAASDKDGEGQQESLSCTQTGTRDATGRCPEGSPALQLGKASDTLMLNTPQVNGSCKLGMRLPQNAAAGGAQPASALVHSNTIPSGGRRAPRCGSSEIQLRTGSAGALAGDCQPRAPAGSKGQAQASFKGEPESWGKARKEGHSVNPEKTGGRCLCFHVL